MERMTCCCAIFARNTKTAQQQIFLIDSKSRLIFRMAASRSFLLRISSILLCVFICSGCGGIQIQSMITPSETAEPTGTAILPLAAPTEEIVWFPPTETPRPLNTPTRYVTISTFPKIGDLLLQDSFSDEGTWQTFRSDQGNAVMANHELTLAIQNGESSITSYAQLPYQADFYLSLDVKLSLCSYHEDSYGFLFRVGNSDNYYRWQINCLGQTKLERRYKGELLPLNDWAVNGQVRPGAPQKMNIGILAKGSTLKFYINKVFLFETNDTVLAEGGFGLFAHSEGYSPLTVSFSNLELYAPEK